MLLNKSQFEAELVSRKVFYFPCPELNTTVSHYFICICNHPINIVNLSCCTSQFDTVRRLIERHRFPPETLVYIPGSDPQNPFTKDTFVNCNEYFLYTILELWIMYTNKILQISQKLIPLDSFAQILNGFHTSPQIEEDMKEMLPSIEDL